MIAIKIMLELQNGGKTEVKRLDGVSEYDIAADRVRVDFKGSKKPEFYQLDTVINIEVDER